MVRNRSRARRSPFVRLQLEPLEDRTLPAAVAWINPAGGDWDTPGNWSTGSVPGPTDDVTINQPGITVTHAGGADDSVNSLDSQNVIDLSRGSLAIAAASTIHNDFALSGGNLRGAGTLTVTGAMTWSGGNMDDGGTLVIPTGATLTIAGNAFRLMHGHTIDNSGAITWTDAGSIRCDAADNVFNNLAGAVFNAQNDSSLDQPFGGTFTFNNDAGATFTKSGAGASTRFMVGTTFNNTGTLQVASGTLALASGASAGSFQVDAGAALAFAGGAHTLTGASSVVGAGDVSFTGGSVSIGGTFAVTGSTNIAGGVAAFNATASTTGATLSNGALAGSGTLSVTAAMTWTAGEMNDGGTLVIPSAASLTIASNNFRLMHGHTINNAGTTTWTDAGGIRCDAGTNAFNNLAGAVFNAQNDSTWDQAFGGTFTFTNQSGATVIKSGQASTSGFSGTFANSGQIQVDSGTFRVASGSSDGSISIVQAATFVVPGGNTLALLNGADVSGDGALLVNNGTLTVAGSANVNNLELTGGVLNGTGTMTVASTMTWSGGDLNDAGTIVIPSGASLTISTGNFRIIRGHNINNSGTITWIDNGSIRCDAGNSVFNNLLGAVFNAQNNSEFQEAFGGTLTINNQAGATFTKFGAGTATSFTGGTIFNNDGTVEIQSGTLALQNGSNTSSFQVDAGAGLGFTVGTYTLTAASSLTGAGDVSFFNGANVSIAGSYAITGATNIAGGGALFNGSATTTTATLSSGGLAGTGTLTVTGSMTWSGGDMNDAGTLAIPAGASLSITTGSFRIMRGHTINNAGTTTWTDSGGIRCDEGANVFNNLGGAVFNAQNDSSLDQAFGGTVAFNNRIGATFNKSGVGTTSAFLGTFTNSGLVHIASGTLRVATGSSDGPITVDQGATLFLPGNSTLSLLSGAAVSGAGSLLVSGGTLTIAGNASVDNLALTSGLLNGAANLTITTAMSWTGGNMDDGGSLAIPAGASLTIVSGNFRTMHGHIINNSGTITWTDNGSIRADAGANVFNNLSGGVFNPQNNSGFDQAFGGTLTFNNQAGASFIRSGAGTGTSFSSGSTFNNDGTAEVASGTLSLQNGSNTSSLQVDVGAALNFTAGAYALTAPSSLTGAGTIGFFGGAVVSIDGAYATGVTNIGGGAPSFNADATTTTAALNGGALNGTGTLSVTGTMTWIGGEMNNGGTLVIPAGASLNIVSGNFRTMHGHTINNSGTITWTDNGSIRADAGANVFNNLAGGVVHAQNDSVFAQAFGGTLSFNNHAGAMFVKSGAGTTTSFVSGAVFNNDGGFLQLASGNLNLFNALSFDGTSALLSLPGTALNLNGDLLGGTTSVDLYKPQGVVQLGGSSKLEVMSQDLGATAAGFTKNFAYGSLQLAGGAAIQLVDLSHNTQATTPEALYVDSLLVPAGASLNLNGLHVYARTLAVAGSVQGGAVNQLAAGGQLLFSTPSSSALSASSPTNDWTFFGRANQAVTVVVHTGSQSSPPVPLPPTLDYAEVDLLDDQGNVLATGSNVQTGADATLLGIPLPGDGVYHLRVQAPAAHPASIGNYSIALFDATIRTNALVLNQASTGRFFTGYEIDKWTFTASANDQVQFNLLNASNSGIEFDLTGPNGFVAFSNATTSSGLITLPQSGAYLLTVRTIGGATGGYAFNLAATTQTPISLGVARQGTLHGSGEAQLFVLDVPQAGNLLLVDLTDTTGTDQNELYLSHGTAPTRSDYQYRATNLAAANQEILVPIADAGTWYILVYGNHVPAASPFTLNANSAQLLLTGATPNHHGTVRDTTITVTGAVFDSATTAQLVAADGTVYSAALTIPISAQELRVTFTAGTVPSGVYSIRVVEPNVGTATLPNSFTMVEGGEAVLTTHLTVPNPVGFHEPSVIYVDYSNTGDIDMPAPALEVTAKMNGLDGFLLTLDPALANMGYRTAIRPPGFAPSVQILASGSIPGLLQPGESVRVPVYYAGLLTSQWDFSRPPIFFALTTFDTNDLVTIDWASAKDSLRPDSISVSAWNLIYPNVMAQVGTTWGSYVVSLDRASSLLGLLGQNVYDVSKLWPFIVQQANGGALQLPLAFSADAQVSEDSAAVTRDFAATISGRNEVGPFGVGWTFANGWGLTAVALPDGSVAIRDVDGSQFTYNARAFGSGFVSLAGDGSTLTGGAGNYVVHYADGRTIEFGPGGVESAIDDGQGHRITAAYTNGQLTKLTDRSGAFVEMTYNAAGRIIAADGSTGESATYTYDSTNTYLTSVTTRDATTTYSYSPATGTPSDNALLTVQYPDGKQDLYGYDSFGALSSYQSGYTVTGQVIDGSGHPLAGASVTLYSQTNVNSQFATLAQGDGSYQIHGVPKGTYDRVVLANGFHAAVTSGVTVSGPTDGGTLTLATSTTTLKGIVVDPAGHAIAAAQVAVLDSAARKLGSAVTAADGSFLITTAFGNNLTVRIVLPGSTAPKVLMVSVPLGTIVDLGPVDPTTPGWLSQLISGQKPRSPNDLQLPLPLPDAGGCCTAQAAAVQFAIEVENSGYDDYTLAFQSLQHEALIDAVAVTLQIAQLAGDIAQVLLGLQELRALQGVADAITLASDLVGDISAISDEPDVEGAIDIVNNIVGSANDLKTIVIGLESTASDVIGALTGIVSIIQDAISTCQTISDSLSTLNTLAATATHAYQRYESYCARAQAAYNSYLNCVAQARNNDCHPPPPPPPPPPPGRNPGPQGGSPGGGGPVTPVGSHDPNGLSGPSGFGPANFVSATAGLPYRIDFENSATATAPAQSVFITNQLAANLDWSTFQLTGLGFGSTNIVIPAGLQFYHTIVSTSENGQTFDVDIRANLDPATGVLTVDFESIDPLTMLPPSNPLTGFLPPEDGSGVGQGYVSYEIHPKMGLATGTQIRNVALISFDGAQLIATDQVDDDDPSKGIDPARQALVTLDAGAPTSHVNSFPSSSSASFTVSWTGQDDAGGSGIGSFDIHVSRDGGPDDVWLTRTTLAQSVFTGQQGHTYSFFSIARDNVGNVQTVAGPAQSTSVPVPSVNLPPVAANDQVSTSADTALNVNVLANDSDPEANALTISAVNITGTKGQVTINAGGTVRYNPNGQFNNVASGQMATDTFTYTISDGHGNSATATVTVNVSGVSAGNHAPVLADDAATTTADAVVTINVLANDSDPDAGNTLSVSGAGTTGTRGQVTVNADGSVRYNPNGAFNDLRSGQTANDTFAYTVSDGHGGSATAAVTITVTGVRQPPSSNFVVTGAGAGGGPAVVVSDPSGQMLFQFFAFDPAFTGGVRVAVGDVNADGVSDIICGAGPGGGPDVRIIDGQTHKDLANFFAFDAGFTGGIYVAAGDVNGDGFADVIVGADAGGGPNVAVFSGRDLTRLQSFFPFDAGFTGGVRVAAGDFDADGQDELVCAAGAGGGPEVTVFDAAGNRLHAFFAYDPGFTGGVYVAAGDVNGDGKAELVTGAGAGGGPNVLAFDVARDAVLANFMAFDAGFTGGVRVAVGRGQILASAGPGGGPQTTLFGGDPLARLDAFFALDPQFRGGAYIGGAD